MLSLKSFTLSSEIGKVSDRVLKVELLRRLMLKQSPSDTEIELKCILSLDADCRKGGNDETKIK